MVLAEEARAVAVEPQHLGKRRHVVWTLARVSRKRRRGLRDRTHVVHVVVPTTQQRGPGRRAEGRRMEMVVAESPVAETFGRRHVNGPPNALDMPNPISSSITRSTFGAPAGALTSIRGGGVALRASNVVIGLILGSGMGSTV